MKIRRIQLYHFRGFEDLQIQFPRDAKSIVFIGENGSGKSSLLEGMSMILRDTLYKRHKYDGVNWNNPLNVHNSFEFGSISIGLAMPERSYEFSKSLSADRTRFVTEDKLALEKGRVLTEEEKALHYLVEGNRWIFGIGNYNKGLECYMKLIEIQEYSLKVPPQEILATCKWIIECYYRLNDYEKAAEYTDKLINIEESISSARNWETYMLYGERYYELNSYIKAIYYFEKAIILKEEDGVIDEYLVELYIWMGRCYTSDSQKTISYYQKAIDFCNKSILEDTDKSRKLIDILHMIGLVYFCQDDYVNAIEYFMKALDIAEKSGNQWRMDDSYRYLLEIYKSTGDEEKVANYQSKINNYEDKWEVPNQVIRKVESKNELYQKSLEYLNEYLELITPLVLHYTADIKDIDNYKDALPMAFRIPMTTDFEIISDWFVEHENEENRKRLRADNNFRSPELELIRKVIDKGLALLNNVEIGTYSELQTELVDAVKDGQVSTWLSIKKSGNTMNVSQLSDGEKRVLVLLIDLTRRLITAGKLNKTTDYLNGAGIVLIDEIEQHLHPKWQRNLMPTLNNLFPNIQFVVTTHSPLVVSNLFHLNGGDNLLTAQKEAAVYRLTLKEAIPIHTTGRDVANVLGEHFGVERRSALYQEKIDGLFADFENDTISIEELKLKLNELKALLGNNDPDVKSAEIIVNGLAEV